jgi:hypothetical protein
MAWSRGAWKGVAGWKRFFLKKELLVLACA